MISNKSGNGDSKGSIQSSMLNGWVLMRVSCQTGREKGPDRLVWPPFSSVCSASLHSSDSPHQRTSGERDGLMFQFYASFFFCGNKDRMFENTHLCERRVNRKPTMLIKDTFAVFGECHWWIVPKLLGNAMLTASFKVYTDLYIEGLFQSEGNMVLEVSGKVKEHARPCPPSIKRKVYRGFSCGTMSECAKYELDW